MSKSVAEIPDVGSDDDGGMVVVSVNNANEELTRANECGLGGEASCMK